MENAVKRDLLLSIVMPCRNEAGNIQRAVRGIMRVLDRKNVRFEMIIVDDHSHDGTKEVVENLMHEDERVRYANNDYPPGFGFGVRKGLDIYRGDAVVIVMADRSDSSLDIVKYYHKLQEGYECVFGTRFCREANVLGYPPHKLLLNRLGNFIIRTLFWLPYNDVTNAFKCYSREAIDGIRPLISCHFNLTVEMPLKAIVRGYSWCVVPTDWYGRKKGISKWKIMELGSKYIFILLYIWLEKSLVGSDYKKGKYWLSGNGKN